MTASADTSQEDVRGAERSEPCLSPPADLLDYLREYAREKPEVVALWCLGIGFVLGWKLKPW